MRTTATLFFAAALLFGSQAASAQDPVKLSPHFYTVHFENEHVRVLEFRAKAGDKEPMHYHPAAVVYLLSSGKARVTFPDGKSQEREAKAGTAFWADSVRHVFEYLGPDPARVLLVEMKSLPGTRTSAGAAADTEGARRELIARARSFERWLETGQIDSLATLVTDDYQALAPNEPIVAGKTAWLEWTRQLLRLGRWSEQLTTESTEVNGPLAVQRGRYILRFVPGAGAPAGTTAMSDTGKFLWHWRKVDGQWRLAAAAWSSDLPSKR
jgi:quercetin dioxygenase-like cupin family protein/ketosteroid isomerase-like protein